ncbi:MAG: hypothetical protein QG597_1661 [Actinomycetota bacterium]|nr:hypothetical protein [Actinomycetota bacterium]
MAKPGKATSAEGVALVTGANRVCTTAVASRARTYARHGQVVGVDLGEKTAVAQVQGSGDEPYLLSLYRRDFGDYTADCDCPYGCGEFYWCKHAVALAYVVADMIDRDLGLLLRWTGDSAATAGEVEAVRIDADRLARLVRPIPSIDVPSLMAAAAEVAPPPER